MIKYISLMLCLACLLTGCARAGDGRGQSDERDGLP